MSNISKLEFVALDISGSNFLPWSLDVKIHLTAKSLGETIVNENKTTLEQKANAMIFLRHHLHEDLKREYLTVEDPLELWKNIQERFDHQKLVILPKARYEWLHLRLQDFKTVSKYNSAIYRITSELKLCGEKITDEDMLEKTYSTFHASNMLIAQQYRERNYTKYSELISVMLAAEQNNKNLLQNHQARPTGSSLFPEANAANHHSRYGRGRGRGPSRGRGRGRSNIWKRESYNTKPRNGESNQKNTGQSSEGGSSGGDQNLCRKCGMTNHWSRSCHTPKHLVEAYQYMMKEKDKNVETNMIEDAPDLSSPAPVADAYLDVAAFVEK